MKEEGSPGEVHRKSEREGRGESERRRGKDGWRKVLYGEYGAAVRRVFIAAAICRPIVITALSNPSYDCMCHAGSMLRPRHRASLRTRIHHFFATASIPSCSNVIPVWTRIVCIYIYTASCPFFVDRPSVNYREREGERAEIGG